MYNVSNLFRSALASASVCFLVATACGQSTTQSLENAGGAPSVETTQTILLVGDKVSTEDGRNRTAVNLERITTSTLGGKVLNRTAAGSSLTSVSAEIAGFMAEKPDLVLLFAGAAEAEAKVPDQEQQDKLVEVGRAVKAGGGRLYVLPSAVNLDTMVVANLQIGATNAEATYVEPGSDMAGRPYEQALEEIVKLEAAVGAPGATTQPDAEATDASLPPLDKKPAVADEATTPAAGVFSPPRRADEKSLISSPAGEDGTGQPTREQDAATTETNPRVITKRGKDVKETINMRPMPALKQYDPKRPVPRTDIDRKAPDLAR